MICLHCHSSKVYYEFSLTSFTDYNFFLATCVDKKDMFRKRCSCNQIIFFINLSSERFSKRSVLETKLRLTSGILETKLRLTSGILETSGVKTFFQVIWGTHLGHLVCGFVNINLKVRKRKAKPVSFTLNFPEFCPLLCVAYKRTQWYNDTRITLYQFLKFFP